MQEVDNLISKWGNIGHGYEQAKCLLIIPKPICEPDFPAAYGFKTEELQIMKGIFSKLEIDPEDWWITTAADETGVVSLPRLCDIVGAISPKLVVVAGREAYNAFFGDLEDDSSLAYGDHDCENYKVYYSMDFSEYIENKKRAPSQSGEFAQILFKQWEEIKALYDQID